MNSTGHRTIGIDECVLLCVYASKVRAVLTALASACIQGTDHSYLEQSRIQHQ